MLKDDRAWSDFFLSKFGLIIIASMILVAGLRVVPMVDSYLEYAESRATAVRVSEKLEALSSTSIPGLKDDIDLARFGDKGYHLKLTAEGLEASNDEVLYYEPLSVKVYPVDPETLSNHFEGRGSFDSPMNISRYSEVENYMESLRNSLKEYPYDLTEERYVSQVHHIYFISDKEVRNDETYILIYRK